MFLFNWSVETVSYTHLDVYKRQAHEVNGKPNPLGAWVMPRDHKETDLYFFGYGRRYTEAVQDFYKLAGPTPLLPRFALGNWWSRYYRYTQDEYLQLMDRFKREGIPFTTSVIDMDWHRVDDVDPKYGSGWTGYSWDKQLFPDHKAFLRDLHERGLKATLNVHPRDGVRALSLIHIFTRLRPLDGVDDQIVPGVTQNIVKSGNDFGGEPFDDAAADQ